MLHFYTNALFALDEDVGYLKKDTVICKDEAGNWYRYVGPGGDPKVSHGDRNRENWPQPRRENNNMIQLFRDYWKAVQAMPTSPLCEYLNNEKCMTQITP